jgi:ribosomal protein L7/L12
VAEAGGPTHITIRNIDRVAEERRWAHIVERHRNGETPDSIAASLLGSGFGSIDVIKALRYGAGLPLADCKAIVDRNLSPERLADAVRLREQAMVAMEQIADEVVEYPDRPAGPEVPPPR